MLDSEQQIDILENYASDHPEVEPWQIFIKVDVGSRRAGLEKCSDYIRGLLHHSEKSAAVNIQGLYCHAGHSYGCRSKESVEDVLQAEIDALIEVSHEVSPGRQQPLVLSLGSTPTAHSIKSIKHKLPSGCILELHAGMCSLTAYWAISERKEANLHFTLRKLPCERFTTVVDRNDREERPVRPSRGRGVQCICGAQ